ncbi:MAG: UDP-glucose/GDP-mannose dehydrogenase family protein [Planctomycetota bacterium]|nr:MAG: UDP-glucose/GDP-mannose dehydrogenase family protein [Planctomycetota bacterium]
MRICVIGSGYVGLVTAACFADTGNHVVGVDIDEDKVRMLNGGRSPIFEPGLEEILATNLAARRLRFTTDVREGVEGARVIFLAVGTPPRDDGSADLTQLLAAAESVGPAMTGPATVVIKSTVPVGTGRRIGEAIRRHTKHPVTMVSNPEFLKEGAAVDDFLRPDRVVIGADDAESAELVVELHRPFVRNNKPILLMSREAAELTKYTANAYLSTRISFINEISELCERLGIDIDQVRRGIGSDSRIGHHFLYPGIGYGGSCFPKDVQALVSIGRDAGVEMEVNAAVHRRNIRQRERMAETIIGRLGPDLQGVRIAVWGLAFKPNTDDIREAPALSIVERLLSAGATVAVHDPRALGSARRVLGDRVLYCEDAYEAVKAAAALVTCTEWLEYRSPDFDAIRSAMIEPLIFDGRNIYDERMMRRYGFEYYSVGRPPLAPKAIRA